MFVGWFSSAVQSQTSQLRISSSSGFGEDCHLDYSASGFQASAELKWR